MSAMIWASSPTNTTGSESQIIFVFELTHEIQKLFATDIGLSW